uniref:Uncharacterized protein n=1 Tax=viral metagenome TaxID=1070528 RepID=A0A6M3LGY8_9ZZZZ
MVVNPLIRVNLPAITLIATAGSVDTAGIMFLMQQQVGYLLLCIWDTPYVHIGSPYFPDEVPYVCKNFFLGE